MITKTIYCQLYDGLSKPIAEWYEVHELRRFLLFWKRWQAVEEPFEGGSAPVKFRSLDDAAEYLDRRKQVEPYSTLRVEVETPTLSPA